MENKTLRLIFPQWQGGNIPLYSFGSEILNYLAPNLNNQVIVKVPITEFDGINPIKENGVNHQSILIKQLNEAKKIIKTNNPSKIITLGGDCLVSQAPIDYLNGKYYGNFGVLWVDAHPDISTPNDHDNEHAMVLGNLLGHGDKKFSQLVDHKITPSQVLYCGLNSKDETTSEKKILAKLKIANVSYEDLVIDNSEIIKWIKQHNFKKVYIHLDVDVIDPSIFHSLIFSNPETDVVAAHGQLNFAILEKLAEDVSSNAELVGLTIAEYLPWDNFYLTKLLNKFSIFKK